MTITSIDQALAGMQPTRFFMKGVTPALLAGRPNSSWLINGIPGAGSVPTTLAGAILSSSSGLVNGQIPYYDPPAGKNSYLARLVGDYSGSSAKIMLCDRLWHNGGFTAITGIQTVNSPTWPARDQNGNTDGVGVLIGIEYNVAGAANAPNVNMVYTNAAGVSGQQAQNAFPIVASPPQATFIPMGLASGDLGVRAVQSVTFNLAPTAGGVNLVAYRVIAVLDCPNIGIPASLDLITGGMPQFFNGSVPFFIYSSGTNSSGYISGTLTTTQG